LILVLVAASTTTGLILVPTVFTDSISIPSWIKTSLGFWVNDQDTMDENNSIEILRGASEQDVAKYTKALHKEKCDRIVDTLIVAKYAVSENFIRNVQQKCYDSGDEQNLQQIKDFLNPNVRLTEIIAPSLSCNCVAFRLDDIRDNKFNNVQTEIINLFMDKNLPLTIGIVGGKFGEDTPFVELIKEKIVTGNLEIANHGWVHEKFSTLNYSEQRILIKLTNDKLFEIFGIVPKVFIPPYNQINEHTVSVLHEKGITHLSAFTYSDFPPFPLKDSTFYSFPVEETQTGDVRTNTDLHQIYPIEHVFSRIKQSLSNYGFAVVLMHPTEFAAIKDGEHINQVNSEPIQELELLIKKIQDEGLRIVPIGKINLDFDD